MSLRRDLARASALLADSNDDLAGLPWGVAPQRFSASPRLRASVTNDDLDAWLDCSLLHMPFFNVLHQGKEVAPHEVTSHRTVDGDPRAGYVDGRKVRAWLDRGGTLMLANLHDWHRPLRDLCREVAACTVARVGATAFVTGPGAAGLRAHRDHVDVVVVQIHGHKRWHVYDSPSEPASWVPGYIDRELPEPSRTLDLHPGDALYLPIGTPHWAETPPGVSSFHVSLTIREPRLREAMNLAVRACLHAVPDHAPLGGGAECRREAARTMVRRLAKTLPQVDIDDLVAALERSAVEGGDRR